MSRSFCYQCHRASIACICGLIPVINNRPHITLLQHPAEATHSKGTAIIAQLYLQNVTTFTGENFSELQSLKDTINQHDYISAIVYPDNSAITLEEFQRQHGQLDNLIFIDATWRKANKTWLTTPEIHHLPCIRLDTDQASNYRIRKASDESHLSTIEAIYTCLKQLDPDNTKYDRLLDVFDKMINFQIEKMGAETYSRNYKK